jgi:hypothetical protein
MEKMLKTAVVLLISSVIVFSSVAVANTETMNDCDPIIDVEKEVWDEKNGIWVSADTEDRAFEAVKCSEIVFRITISNTGDCPIYLLMLWDIMHIGLKYVSADPPPDEEFYEDEWLNLQWYLNWIYPGEELLFYITAHVEGEECTYSVNMADAGGWCQHEIPVLDEDDCWIHSMKKSKSFENPLLKLFQNHLYLFQLLQKILIPLRIRSIGIGQKLTLDLHNCKNLKS